MELLKKTGAAAAAAMLLLGTQPALAARSLAEDEVAAAKIQANKLVPKKRVDFAFRSRADAQVTAPAKGNASEEMEAEAYLLTPYCYIMSLQLIQGRTGHVDFAALDTAAQNYQLRLRFTGRGFDRDSLSNMKIDIRQGALHELTPESRRYTTVQRVKGDPFLGEGSWSRVGIVLDIPAEQIESGLPIVVTAKDAEGRTLTFEPLHADGAFDQYDTRTPVFSWTPLHDSI